MGAWNRVTFHADSGCGAPRFEWPIQIGVVDADGAEPWVEAIEQHPLCGPLYSVSHIGVASRACTLLVMHGSCEEATHALSEGPPVRAELVLLVTEGAKPSVAELRALRQVARSRAVAAVAGDDPAMRALDLIAGLSHDRSLAEALGDMQAQVLGSRRDLRKVRLRHWARDLVVRAKELTRRVAPGDSSLPPDNPRSHPEFDDLASSLGLTGDSPAVLARRLVRTLQVAVKGSFAGESHEATVIGRAARAISLWEELVRAGQREGLTMAFAQPDESPELEPPPPRHLQARTRSATGGPLNRLVPDRDFLVQVQIAPPAKDWLGLEVPMPVPATAPRSPGGWPLRVVLWDANHAPTPMIRPLLLPEIAPSAVVSFALHAGSEAPPLECRITVLDDNEVLQTGLLRVPGAGEAGEGPRFVIDAAPQPVLNRTSGQRWFDAALVLNHSDDGTPRATIVQDDTVAVVPLEAAGLASFVKLVDGALSGIARKPEIYDGLRAKGTVELLRELAIRGSALHRRLLHDGALDQARFSGDGPLQVTAAKSDSYLPVEFLYCFPAPDDDADLCAGAEVALASGVCSSGCAGDTRFVCPLGFWGLRRVIERHTYRVKEAYGMTAPFVLSASDLLGRDGVLRPLTRAMVGASNVASAYDADAVQRLVDDMAPRVRTIKRADRWDLWAASARAENPSLIVLLPHHEAREGSDFLHIGADSELLAARITEAHVGRAAGAEAPIVLLIGCETQFARVQFDDFVSAFRYAGARVVVATVATILGRHAARAAASLIAIIDDLTKVGPIRLGEAMLAARRTLLKDGMPMALGLTAYGDADWTLAAAS